MAGFITRWTVAGGGASNTITLPLYNSGVFNCTVNWGDGTPDSTVTTFDDVDIAHTYAIDGTYDVEITGECPAWSFNNTGDKLKIVAVVDWGDAGDFGGFQYLSGGFFGCINITSLGTGKIQAKVGLVSLLSIFYNCTSLTSIPSGLFDNCVNVTTFQNVFRFNTSLTSIPSGLFDNCISASSGGFYAAFYSCIALTTIPAALFDNCVNVSVNGFSYAFYGCTGLISAPDNLFKFNVLCNSFDNCFIGCIKLQLNKNIFYTDGEQSTRFLDRSVNFTNCFNRTSFTGAQGTAPDLWNCNFGTGSAIPTACFSSAGNSLTSIDNYNDIPVAWGGPYTGLGYWTSRNNTIQGLKNEGVLRVYHDYRSGTLKDWSSYAHNGVNAGNVSFTKKSLQYNTSGGVVEVTDDATLQALTGCLIARCSPGSGGLCVIASKYLNPNYQFYWLYSGGALTFQDTAAPTPSLTIPLNDMQTIAINFSQGGTPSGYLNGVFFGNYSTTWTSAAVATNLKIGNFGTVNAQIPQRFEYFLWISRELTAAEHQALYYDLQVVQ